MEDRKYLTPGDVKLLHDSYEYIRLELIEQKKDNHERWKEHDSLSLSRHENLTKNIMAIKDIVSDKPCKIHNERTLNNKISIDRLATSLWAILVLLVALAIKSFL